MMRTILIFQVAERTLTRKNWQRYFSEGSQKHILRFFHEEGALDKLVQTGV